MRRHRRSTRAGDVDRLRDTATYAITIDDWDDVKTPSPRAPRELTIAEGLTPRPEPS